MKNTLRTAGPSLAVFMAVAWWCWPHVVGPVSSLPRSESEPDRLDRSLLDPAIPPPEERNPFELVVQEALDEKTTDEPELSDSDEAPAAQPCISAADLERTVNSLELRGTFINGDRNCALIGEHIYREGSQVPLPIETDVQCILASVSPDGVVLHFAGRELQLGPDRATVVDDVPGSTDDPGHARVRPSRDKAGAAEPRFGISKLLGQLNDYVPSAMAGVLRDLTASQSGVFSPNSFFSSSQNKGQTGAGLLTAP